MKILLIVFLHDDSDGMYNPQVKRFFWLLVWWVGIT